MIRAWQWPAILSALLVAGMAASVATGPVRIPWRRVVHVLWAPEDSVDANELIVVRELRLPRVLLAAAVGAGLGVAGAAYQAVFRNPLADPFLIGSSNGAALGAALAIIAGWDRSAAAFSPLGCAAFAGALLAVAATWCVAKACGRSAATSLLLAGVAVSSFVGALVSLLMFVHSNDLMAIFAWIMGGLSGRGWSELASSAPLILLGSLATWMLARALDALAFGDETATSLGLPVDRLRAAALAAASLTTAAAVAVAGVIGFVGLAAPHVARLLTGSRHARLIPTSALAGALLLLAADDAARTLGAPGELPLGIVTALVGSPFFVYILIRNQRAPTFRS